MGGYTNIELADMFLAYWAKGCSGPVTKYLHEERYPVRRNPNRKQFERLHQRLDDTCSFQRAVISRERSARISDIEENALCTNGSKLEYASSSTPSQRVLLQRLQDSRRKRDASISYAPQITFSRWFLQNSATYPLFSTSLLFTDEACFSRKWIYNTHKARV